LLFAAYNTNKIKIWDTLLETSVGEISSENSGNVMRSISLSEDGTILLSAGKDGRIQKWVV
jgi:WD40 repeat protein